MTLPQHLVPTLADAAPGGTVRVEGDEAHHAVVVRRMRVGERLTLCDGAGRTATAEVAATGKRWFEARVETVDDRPEPAPRVTVVQALPKGDRGELAVEVLTEVGVARIVPWAAERSVAVWKGERAAKAHAKWAATAREAAKQSRRAHHPVVEPLATTDALLATVRSQVEAGGLVVVLHEEDGAPLATVPVGADTPELLVVVGPEGGLTSEEIDALVTAGAMTVRLGEEVLRTSTAGLAAVSGLLARTTRWGG